MRRDLWLGATGFVVTAATLWLSGPAALASPLPGL